MRSACSLLFDTLIRTPHVDIYSLSTVGFDYFPSREKYLRRIPKYLKHEWMLNRIMCEDSLDELWIMMEPISTIKF